MDLQELASLVRRIWELTTRHQALPHQNEVLTRCCLVDPLLRALGWEPPTRSECEWRRALALPFSHHALADADVGGAVGDG